VTFVSINQYSTGILLVTHQKIQLHETRKYLDRIICLRLLLKEYLGNLIIELYLIEHEGDPETRRLA